ncbi:TetR/AcrR family transcriptional regulator [Streptomonospora nanhaiensis]|uniref:TetR/AcrR family transcriptional regulator n=1 Tax=Streptomonospora nanhaiensis TaxID=1323731 RepID=UPI001C389FE7|nr:TetR/AcrR family transcriptional regulator [Streptomonospora nanhaiensis]MBV2362031.1 TetR/AcrR family transcriptional regulator [Streptomonospora nanhaiensis]
MEREPATRRRGSVLEDAIFAAVAAELAEVGYTRLTVTAVADRAGTSKPVLYRRWPSRAHLVYAAVSHGHRRPGPVPDTGSLRGDLLEWLADRAALARRWSADTLWGLLAESAADPALLAEIRGDLARPDDRRQIAEIVARAAARGEAAAADPAEPRLDLPAQLLRERFLLDRPLDPAALERIVDHVLLPLLSGR